MRVDVPWSRQADIAARTTVSVVTEYVDAGASGGMEAGYSPTDGPHCITKRRCIWRGVAGVAYDTKSGLSIFADPALGKSFLSLNGFLIMLMGS